MTEPTPATSPAPTPAPTAPAAVQIDPVLSYVAAIKQKILVAETLSAQIAKDIANAPAEVQAEFEMVEGKVLTFVKTHLGAAFLIDAVTSIILGVVIAHVLK